MTSLHHDAAPLKAESRGGADKPEVQLGTVVSHQANFYYVQVGNDEVACHMRGRLKKEGETPLVGDRVEIVLEPLVPGEPLPPPRAGSLVLEQAATRGVRRGFIVAIAPRTRTLERPAIANVDQLLIVMAAASPAFSSFLLDKFLVVASRCGLTPVIVINKRDLVEQATLDGMTANYRALGYHVVPTEARNKGIDGLLPLLAGRLSVLAGPSGVGKSSIVNAIQPGLQLAANDVSTKLQRGRHTTRHAALYPLDGVADALLADTPGFSFLSLEGLLPAELGWSFPEMVPHIPACRLPSCLHVSEPACAVKAAPNLPPDRYDSYLRLLEECQAYERDIAARSIKEEANFKRRSGRNGSESRFVKVDAQARQGDRRTRNQHLSTHWHEEEDAADDDTQETATGGI